MTRPQDVPEWFIDPLQGRDNPDHGRSAAQPLRTHEFLRQLIGGAPIDRTVTVHLLNDFDDDNPVIVDWTVTPNGIVNYGGARPTTVLHTGTFTDFSPISRSANQATIVEDTSLAMDWGPSGFINTPTGTPVRIRVTSGAAAGAIAWPAADLGAKTARTSPFGVPITSSPGPDPTTRLVDPSVGDAFVVETDLVRINLLSVNYRNVQGRMPGPILPGLQIHSVFSDIALDADFSRRPSLFGLTEQVFPPTSAFFSGCAVGRLTCYGGIHGCDFSMLQGFSLDVRGGQLDVLTSLVVPNVFVRPGATLRLEGDTLFQTGRLFNQGEVLSSAVGIFDTLGNGLEVFQAGTVGMRNFIASPAALYGAGSAAFGVRCQAGGTIIYPTPAQKPTIVGAIGELNAAGAVTTWAGFGADFTNKLAGVQLET